MSNLYELIPQPKLTSYRLTRSVIHAFGSLTDKENYGHSTRRLRIRKHRRQDNQTLLKRQHDLSIMLREAGRI